MPLPAKRWLLALAGCTMLVVALPALASAGAVGDASYSLSCDDPGWDTIFSTFGLSKVTVDSGPDIAVACGGNVAQASDASLLRPGKLLVLVGDSPLARSHGFIPINGAPASVRSVRQLQQPELLIVWQEPQDLVPVQLPAEAVVLAEERWSKQPLVAMLRRGADLTVLWLAASPGNQGYDRFPFLASALLQAGFVPPFRTRNLWAFFDSAYRRRADPEYLASRWQRFGIAVLHVSAWQHWEREQASDAWLNQLIAACHRHGILVYAWFEFPHVSERFWAENEQCREQTALGQDAQLDWRKLINLADPACAERVRQQTIALLEHFAWDGVNLAEIYYESLEGIANPARFTPMNSIVRAEFAASHGVDPAELFDESSARHHTKDPKALSAFLEYRRDKIMALHEEWLAFLRDSRGPSANSPHLVVTQIDDRFDTSVRDNLGVDSSRLLALMHQIPFTLLVEDPATIWHLGSERYPAISSAYLKESAYPERLAIDINIFPRYQEVYPTKQQTGIELYRLVHAASQSFPRVALYFEHTLSAADLPLLSAAAIPPAEVSRVGDALRVKSGAPVGLRWKGPAQVDGRPWPARDAATLWLPAGTHTVTEADRDPPLRLHALIGELLQAYAQGQVLELHYRSEGPAIAGFSAKPTSLMLDGEAADVECHQGTGTVYCLLPAGEHLVRAEAPYISGLSTERSQNDKALPPVTTK